MSAQNKFQVPSSFAQYLDEHDERRRVLAELRKQKAIREKKEDQRRQKKKEIEVRRGIKYARIIFGWVASFRDTEAGKRAVASLPRSFRPGGELTFFEWHPGWGYLLATSDNGIMWYRFGTGSEEVYCRTPEELARAAQLDMLKTACKAIQDGEVWQWVKKDLNLFVRGIEVECFRPIDR